jgi:Tannase and feruloyl esterase
MVEQAVKTKALVSLYYGKAPKYTYYDGHSQAGRQGLKIAQEYPELYDGFMIAQPALSVPMFGTTALYTQIVMKAELGFTAVNKTDAAAFAAKVNAETSAPSRLATMRGLVSSSIPSHATTIPRATQALCATVCLATA